MKKFLVYTCSTLDNYGIGCLRLLYNSILERNNIDDFDFLVLTDKINHPELEYKNCKIICDTSYSLRCGDAEYWSVLYLKYTHLIPDGYDFYVYLDSDILFYEKLENIIPNGNCKISVGIELICPHKIIDSPWHFFKFMEDEYKERAKNTHAINAGQFAIRSSEFKNQFFSAVQHAISINVQHLKEFSVTNVGQTEQTAFNYAVLKFLEYTDIPLISSRFTCVPEAARHHKDYSISIHHFTGDHVSKMKSKYHRMLDFISGRKNTENHADHICYHQNRILLAQNYINSSMIGAELGVFQGIFSKQLVELKPSFLFLVDVFQGMQTCGDESYLDKGPEYGSIISANLSEEYEKIKHAFADNKNVQVVRSTTSDFLTCLPDNMLDFVYIDANHSHEGVKLDLNLSFCKVKNGGYIMGHKYTQKYFSCVVHAVDEFCREKNLKIDAISNCAYPSYCIQVKK